MTLREVLQWPHQSYWRMVLFAGGLWGGGMAVAALLGVMGPAPSPLMALFLMLIGGPLFGIPMATWVWLVKGRFAFQKQLRRLRADGSSPYHAHVYFTAETRDAAARLRDAFSADPEILFVGRMIDHGIGPHPIPQYEIHFLERSAARVTAILEASGLRCLVHPLTSDDLADHTTLGHWIGEPVELDLTVLDPPGVNQGLARFGRTDF